MSDFMAQDILPKLWDEILKCHWTYFDTEESILKLEKRKKLEECLKEFLCIVQHDRKFFLPETGDVLKKSIQEMEHFSAQNAINAFESISQYANNLFTKPWRKEFRILKMYSGYYQHEIKSNLLNADRLFEAMGYRRLSEDTLILDGPICPDQVTNVSRDAMTAYVELQIIKHIHSVLVTNGINVSWLDIFRYREKYTGGISQAIKALPYVIEEKRYRSRDRALTNDNYGYIDVQPSSNYLGSNAKFGTAQCQCHLYQQLPPTTRHQQMAQTNGMCCLPEHHQQPSRAAPNLMYSNMSYPAQHNYHHHQANLLAETDAGPLPQMSHSRSLEHYSEPANNHHMLPHRHSFDHQQQGCTAAHQQHPYLRQQQIHQQQQQHNYQYLNHPHQNFYESPYDCIDGNSMGGGSSSISYAAVAANAASVSGNSNCNMNTNSTYAHPYNVSGNRFPLPLNISNQISAYDNLQKLNYVGSQDPTYAHIGDHYLYSSVARQAKNCGVNSGAIQNSSGGYNTLNQVHGLPNSPLSKEPLPRQRSYQTEQLISFDDPSMLAPLTAQQQFEPPLHQYQPTYEQSNHLMDKRYLQPAATTCQHYIAGGKTATNDDGHVYAKPTPRESRSKPFQNSNHLRNPSFNSGERGGGDTTDISYESANEELVNQPSQLNERNHLHSPTQFTKNQDGVGSFESWDYVFQNLERSGYSKDLGDREDLLVQSLDLDSLNINNDTSPSQASSAEKRRSNYAGNENKNPAQQQQSKQQQLVQLTSQVDTKQNSQTFKNSKSTSKNNTKMDMTTTTSSVTSNSQKQRTLADNNEKKIKSALKQTNATSKTNPNPNKAQQKNNDNKSSAKTLNNNNNETFAIFENGTTQRKKSSTLASVKKSSQSAPISSNNAAPSPPLTTQIIVTAANEWSCTYCTFINPNTRRICEMCCRTKDNKLDATANTTAAGTTAVAHNTTTCA